MEDEFRRERVRRALRKSDELLRELKSRYKHYGRDEVYELQEVLGLMIGDVYIDVLEYTPKENVIKQVDVLKDYILRSINGDTDLLDCDDEH